MSHLYHFNFGGDALGSSGTNIWKIRDTGRPKMMTIKAITCIIFNREYVVRPERQNISGMFALLLQDPLTVILQPFQSMRSNVQCSNAACIMHFSQQKGIRPGDKAKIFSWTKLMMIFWSHHEMPYSAVNPVCGGDSHSHFPLHAFPPTRF